MIEIDGHALPFWLVSSGPSLLRSCSFNEMSGGAFRFLKQRITGIDLGSTRNTDSGRRTVGL